MSYYISWRLILCCDIRYDCCIKTISYSHLFCRWFIFFKPEWTQTLWCRVSSSGSTNDATINQNEPRRSGRVSSSCSTNDTVRLLLNYDSSICSFLCNIRRPFFKTFVLFPMVIVLSVLFELRLLIILLINKIAELLNSCYMFKYEKVMSYNLDYSITVVSCMHCTDHYEQALVSVCILLTDNGQGVYIMNRQWTGCVYNEQTMDRVCI
jgi:hypothetical protein